MLVVPSPVEAIPLISPPAVIDRSPGPGEESSDCPPAQDAHPSAARAATATPSPAATTHRSAPDFSHNGSSNAPHTHRLTPNAATVTMIATSHLPARLILATPPIQHGRSAPPQSQAKPGSGAEHLTSSQYRDEEEVALR